MNDFEFKIEAFKPSGISKRRCFESHRILARDRFHAGDELRRVLSEKGYERVSIVRIKEVTEKVRDTNGD